MSESQSDNILREFEGRSVLLDGFLREIKTSQGAVILCPVCHNLMTLKETGAVFCQAHGEFWPSRSVKGRFGLRKEE